VLTMMLTSLLIGAVIGLRFRVYVLLASIGVTLVIVASSGDTFPEMIGEMIGSLLALQVGFLLGILGRLPLGGLMNVRGRRSASLRAPAHTLLDS
jgi:uncharacterized membrane protein YkvI